MLEAQAASLRLAERTEQALSNLWVAHVDEQLTLDQFEALTAATVARANTAAVQLADIGVATEASTARGEVIGPLGLAPTAVQIDQARIRRDIERILDEIPETVEPMDLASSRDDRFRRLGRTEPLLTMATTVQTAMTGQGATGWIRQLDAVPCAACISWADGVVRHPSTRMARHLGCGCIQQPIFT